MGRMSDTRYRRIGSTDRSDKSDPRARRLASRARAAHSRPQTTLVHCREAVPSAPGRSPGQRRAIAGAARASVTPRGRSDLDLDPECPCFSWLPCCSWPSSHWPSASFCALLTALLLLAVPVDLSSHHSCIGGAEKAHRELQFAWRRPQTAEIRCSRDALCRTGRQPVSVHF